MDIEAIFTDCRTIALISGFYSFSNIKNRSVKYNFFSSLEFQALVYVSTAFSQCDKPVVEEIIYPCDVDWKKMITIAESIDNDYLKAFTAK